MRSYKKIMPIFLAAALIGTAVFSIKGRVDASNAYDSAMNKAREYAANGIVVDAIAQYETAISHNPTLEAYLEAGQVYLDNEDYSSARKWYKNELKTAYPKAPETYLYGINLYLPRDNYRMVFDVYNDYKARQLYSEEVELAVDQIRYKYDLAGKFEQVGAFSNQTNTAAVRHDGLWGYIKSDLDYSIPYIFSEASNFTNYAAVKDAEGNPYYIDSEGNIKINETTLLNADPEFGQVEKFQPIQSGLILAFNGDIWNYYRMDSMEKLCGGFSKATPISNGVGAVSMDGKKWALISEEGQLITDYIYDEVLMDSKSILCRGGALLVKTDGKYKLIDRAGNQLGNNVYDKAVAFNDASFAAVFRDGQWMYIDPAGNEFLKNHYEEARSYSCGLAAVKQNGKWGYMDKTGKLVLPCEFAEAEPFWTEGLAFVKTEEGHWSLLVLYQYSRR